MMVKRWRIHKTRAEIIKDLESELAMARAGRRPFTEDEEGRLFAGLEERRWFELLRWANTLPEEGIPIEVTVPDDFGVSFEELPPHVQANAC